VAVERTIQDEIEDEATRWVIERDVGLSPKDRRALEQWLVADPLHQRAFARAESVWGMMGSDAIQSEIDQRRTVEPRLPGYPPLGRDRYWRRWLAPALAASLALVMIGAANDWPTAVYADAMTGTGEQRRVTLDDGSIVQLNTGSAITIDYGSDRRIIHLLKGEAAFTVATDRQRPFTVEAGSGSTTARGTRFIVRHVEDDTEVGVTEHSVRVANLSGPDRNGVVVKEGQTVRYGAHGITRPETADTDALSAWTRGRLVFVDRPLREVVAELARYHRGYICILDADLGNRRVSGIFRTDDPVAALDTLQRSLGIGSTRITDRLAFLHS
jgi:transmembrane sensor